MYHSVQRQSCCKHDVCDLDTINAADLDETYGNDIDEYLDIHGYDDETDDETDDDTEADTDDGANDDTDDGGRGHLYSIKAPSRCS